MNLLSEKERKVLAAAQLKAGASAEELAKLCGLQARTVRQVLQRLKERSFIQRRALVNPCAAGYQVFHLLLSIAPESKKAAEEFATFMAHNGAVADLNCIGGDYHYELQFCGRTIQDVADYFDQISRRFGPIIQKREFSVFRSYHLLGSRWIYNGKASAHALEWEAGPAAAGLDSTDLEIMHALSGRDCSNRDMAQRLGLSASTLEYRLKRLRECRALCGDFYEVRADQVGMHSFMFLLYCRLASSDMDRRLQVFCSSQRAVDLIVKGFGGWDYLLNVEAEFPHDASSLSQALLASFGKELFEVKIIPRLQNLKYCPFPVGRAAVAPNKSAAVPAA